MGAGWSFPAYFAHPQMAGTPPDLSKVDDKLKSIISQFKSATGTDLFTLKGMQFMQVVNSLAQGGNIFKNAVVPPTQDEFARMLGGNQTGSADMVYYYYFKSGGSSSTASVGGEKSWWESLFGGGSTAATDGKPPVATPDAAGLSSLLSSVAPASGTSTTPAPVVPGATTQPVTAAAPAPGWGSYASNAVGSATSGLTSLGNTAAGVPAPAVPTATA